MAPSPTPTRKRPKRRNLGAYKDAKGVWTLDLTYKGHRVRKRLGKGLSADTVKQVAQREALALRTSILLTGKPPEATPKVTDVTIAAALDHYERLAFPMLRLRSRRVYRRQMRPLRALLGTITFGALAPLDLERYKRDRSAPSPGRRGTGHVAINRELVLLHGVFRKCLAWGLLAREDDPFKAVARYKEPRGRERTLSYQEETVLLQALPEPARTVVQLGIECGARIQSELLPVRWEDLDLGRGVLHLSAANSKNGKGRSVPLSAGMVGKLAVMKETSTSPYVFPAARGGFAHRFQTTFYTALKRAGLRGQKISPHTMRHTFASRLVESGADLVTVRDLGGWSDLSLVSRYSHHRPQRAREAIEAMVRAREAVSRPAPTLTVVGPTMR